MPHAALLGWMTDQLAPWTEIGREGDASTARGRRDKRDATADGGLLAGLRVDHERDGTVVNESDLHHRAETAGGDRAA